MFRQKLCYSQEGHRLENHIQNKKVTVNTHCKNREAGLQYLHDQYQDFFQQNVQPEDATHDINNISDDLNTTMEGSIFEDIIANPCIMHEGEDNFVCTLSPTEKKRKFTNIGNLRNDGYYEHDCISIKENLSQNLW